MRASAMAGRAACQLALVAHAVSALQFAATRELIGGGLPPHIENPVGRSQIFFRGAMTVEAPLHVQRYDPRGQRHGVDPAMAGRASDAFGDVDAVIEIDEVGQVVDAIPSQRRAAAVRAYQRPQHRRFGIDLRVAGHAGRKRWDTCESGGLYRGVAVAAIDPVVGDVMLMAERHALLDRRGQLCVRPRIDAIRDQAARAQREPDEQEQAQHESEASREDLRHCDDSPSVYFRAECGDGLVAPGLRESSIYFPGSLTSGNLSNSML